MKTNPLIIDGFQSARSDTLRPVRFLITCILCLLPAFALRAQFTYTTNNNAITITGYSGGDTNLDIPATIDGLPVTAIDAHAFQYQTDLYSATIPDGVTIIGDFAFDGCYRLREMVLVDSVTAIGNSAFSGCLSLRDITIPDGVTFLGDQAFQYCASLGRVIIGNGVTRIGYQAFDACWGITNLTLGTNLVVIADGAFRECADLGSVTIPDSVTGIGNDAFDSCLALANLTIGSNVTSIGNGAFNACTNLANVTIPGSVTNLAQGAFGNCTHLATVTFEGALPVVTDDLFSGASPTVYYLPGSAGWGDTFAGLPTLLWNPIVSPTDPGFGPTNGMFGFNITGTPGITVVVESSTNLAQGTWTPGSTNILVGGTSSFVDPSGLTTGGTFYRIRTP